MLQTWVKCLLAVLAMCCSLGKCSYVDMGKKTLDTLLAEVRNLRSSHEDLLARQDVLEDRVKKLEELAMVGTLRTCHEYAQYGLKTSGLYMVDPDGPLLGKPPFQVFCDFDTGKQGNICFPGCEAQGKGRAKGRPRKVTQGSFIDGGWWMVDILSLMLYTKFG